MKIRFLLIIIISLVTFPLTVSSESLWEGSAAMSRYGEFPVKGLYGASNSFPVNSIIEVSNPVSKKKVEIIIVNTLEDNNIFLLLSKDASEKLSINQDEIVTVKAKLVKKFIIDEKSDKDITEDPDYNPVAAAEMIDEYSEPELDEDSEAENEIKEEKLPEDDFIETIIIADIPENNSVAEEAPEDNAETEEKTDVIEGITVLPVSPDGEGDTALDEEAEKDPLVNEEVDETEYESKLVLVPSGPKPPAENIVPDSRVADEISDTATDNELTENEIILEKDSYYLQIGAFRDLYSAENLKKTINVDYPVFVYKTGENGIYKVMAGPLKKDEKGAALYQVRIKGIKDAFIRKGE